MDNLKIIDKDFKKDLLYYSPSIKTPYHDSINVIFADFTASSRPSPMVEYYVTNKVLPYYSNTHSNAYCGILMKEKLLNAKKYIRRSMNINTDKRIIFTGNGTTAATNHLIYCMNLCEHDNINIYVSIYEHHSNYLPWLELHNKNDHIKVIIIPPTDDLLIDTDFLENSIKNSPKDTYNIISITACSNVIGIMYDIPSIYKMLQKYNTDGKKNILLADYACCAPYMKIDANYVDALFLSPHKFLGGHSTPGLLVADKKLFCEELAPFAPGGGCVKKVCKNGVVYSKDIEKKESGGTPNIVGTIKTGFIFALKDKLIDLIHHNEKVITGYVFKKFEDMRNRKKDLVVIMPEKIDNRLPIVCFNIKNYHYNLIVVLLNDLFGIQTRGGISCTSLLSDHIKKLYDIDGWCRVTFNWLMDKEEVDYIIESIEYVVNNIAKYENKYKYDKDTNLYEFIK